MNPCSSREHIEDLDNPGFCLWCRSPMRRRDGWTHVASRAPLGAFGISGCPECGMRKPPDNDHAARCSRRPSSEAGASFTPLRAARPHDHGVSLVCTACGAEFPEPCEPDCPRPPDTIAILLDAVAVGATLMLTGPDLLSGDRNVAGQLESMSGATYANAEGTSIGPMLVELARRWLLQRAPGEQVRHDPESEQQQPSNEPAGATDLEQRRE